MKNFLLGAGLLAGALTARAQGEYANWYFGTNAGLRFEAGRTVPLTDGQLVSQVACATLSDAAGRLLLYSNGEQAWNARHQLLVNGDSLGGTQQTPQGCAVLPVPGAGSTRAYLFGMRYGAAVMPFSTGQPWAAEVDLGAAGGRGQVTRRLRPVVADSILARLGERQFAPYQALVRHANGVDCWLVTRLHQQGTFLASLITGTPSWPCPTTVVSRVLPARISSAATWCGGLAPSPNGRSLLYDDVARSFLLAFDPATGRVSNPLELTLPAPSVAAGGGMYCFGAVFSPDGSKAYVSRTFQTINSLPLTQVVQFDVAAGSAAAVSSSGLEINLQVAAPGVTVTRQPFVLQRGGNGKIYGAVNDVAALDVINQPNSRGAACQYVERGQLLDGRLSARGLPAQPSDANLLADLTLPDAYGCVGQPLLLQAGGALLGTAGDSLRWTTGPGRLPQRTTASVLAATYAQPGSYPISVALRRGGQTVRTVTGMAYVLAPSPVSLGRDTLLCTPFALQLAPRTPVPPSSALRWSDGSTGPTLTATQPGIYWLELTNGNGCATRDSLIIRCVPASPAPLLPNLILPNSPTANQTFVLAGLRAADWRLQMFSRWGRLVYEQASYDNRWAAEGQPAGLYYYLLHNAATGQRYRGWVEVVK